MFKIKCLRSLIVVKCVKKMSKALKSPLLPVIEFRKEKLGSKFSEWFKCKHLPLMLKANQN